MKKYWRNIEDIKSPSKEVQLAAVKQNGSAIRYIENPCKKVQKYLILNNLKAAKKYKEKNNKSRDERVIKKENNNIGDNG